MQHAYPSGHFGNVHSDTIRFTSIRALWKAMEARKVLQHQESGGEQHNYFTQQPVHLTN